MSAEANRPKKAGSGAGGTASSSGLSERSQHHIDRAYLDFLIWQCDGFNMAFIRATSLAEVVMRSRDTGPIRQAFSDFQSALVFAANVSKMLWPNSPSSKVAAIAIARGVRLRKLVGVHDDPVLKQNHLLRNDFEHLDERIDIWTTTPNHNIMLHAFGPDSAIIGLGPNERFNRYDPATKTLSMLDHSINIVELQRSVNAVREAGLKAIQRIEHRLWQPSSPSGFEAPQ